MANETDTGRPAVDIAGAALAELATRPFDPATLLTARPALPVPYEVGPAIEVVHTFDPAVNLGDAARRGPAMIGDGKPLVATIGGVEVVTIPMEHYAALLSPLALSRYAASAGSTPKVEGMLELLTALRAEGVITAGGMANATGLTVEEVADRVAAWKAAQPKPWNVDSMDADGTMRGKTHEGVPLYIGPALDPAASPVEIAPTPEEATVDLVPDCVDVQLTASDAAEAYDGAVQRGEVRGGAMDRAGQAVEAAGKGVAAHDAERGSAKRSRR